MLKVIMVQSPEELEYVRHYYHVVGEYMEEDGFCVVDVDGDVALN